MKQYEIDVCEALQHDLKVLGSEWELYAIHNMWSTWSEMCFAGWLGYQQGDIEMLKTAITMLREESDREELI